MHADCMSILLLSSVLVGVVAGMLTTISGFGGGILLLLAVTVLAGAKAALAATSLALLAANTHRIWLYRRHVFGAIDGSETSPDKVSAMQAMRPVAVIVPLVAGLIPGGLCGSLVAASIPEAVIHIAMLVIVSLSLLRAWLGWIWQPDRRSLVLSGVVVGVLSGAAGGAGFLIGPVVLATGLTGRSYLATVAIGAVALHVARLSGYGAGGMLSVEVLAMAAVLTPALVLGNLVGDRVRDAIPRPWQRTIEYGMPAVCLTLALVGLG